MTNDETLASHDRILRYVINEDLENALANIGNVKDRSEFEWRLKRALEDRRV